jgi:tRNA (cytidine32/guanosine34-2'-O)-methyltransferase
VLAKTFCKTSQPACQAMLRNPLNTLVEFQICASKLCSKMGKSSKDKRDAYYRLAKEQNWRARSAFKLIQLDEQFDLFSYTDPTKCTRVVDLCAAPGSWSQVLSRVLIRGESFGRRAWAEKMAGLKRQQEREERQLEREERQLEREERQLARAEAAGGEDGEVDMASLTLGDGDDDENSDLNSTMLQPRENVKIVAIDLQPMASLPGIIQLKADITHPSTVPLLLKALDSDFDPSNSSHRVDLVISDGAPDVTGLHDLDIYVQAQLLHSALSLAMKVLRPGGKFVAKIFRGKDVDLIYAQLKVVFDRVHVAKPRSSRASSIEAFVVCEGFRPVDVDVKEEVSGKITESSPADPSNTTSPLQSQSRHLRPDGITELHFNSRPNNRWIAPFLACGDLSAWDSDATYKLPTGHISLPPVQPPTAPPYAEAIARRRAEGGMFGKTKGKDKDQTKQTSGEERVNVPEEKT